MSRNLEGPIPRYLQLADQLQRDIAAGVYKDRQMLPTELELEKTTGLSRGTIRHALSELRRKGLIDRIQGVGTIVTREPVKGRRRPERYDAVANFSKWKSTVGLPSSFPRLRELDWRALDTAYESYDHRHALLSLIRAVENNNSVALSVTPGQGATTAARYIEKYLKDRHVRGANISAGADVPQRLLPVRITWSMLGNLTDLPRNFDTAVRAGIARGVLGSSSEDDRIEYHSGKERLVQLLGTDQEHYHQPYPSPIRWDAVRQISPTIADQPLSEFTRDAHQAADRDIVFLFDLSGSRNDAEAGQKRSSLFEAIRNLRNDETGAATGAFREVYFADNETIKAIKGELGAIDETIAFPSFAPMEVYTMIMDVNPQKEGGQMLRRPTAVVPDRLMYNVANRIEQEGGKFTSTPLVDLAVGLEQEIMLQMDRPWHDVPYALKEGGSIR